MDWPYLNHFGRAQIFEVKTLDFFLRKDRHSEEVKESRTPDLPAHCWETNVKCSGTQYKDMCMYKNGTIIIPFFKLPFSHKNISIIHDLTCK